MHFIFDSLEFVLSICQSLTANYGAAIILMTFLLKLMLSPLQFLSMASMNKMTNIQPELKRIKEKFSSEPTKIQSETLKVFKENSVNPLMGFIPVLLQLPLFFAFYKLLRNSPHIVGANFGGWLLDLSLPDPLYVLPIVAGLFQLALMFYNKESSETKMNGKVKLLMSAAFTGIMLKLPAALLLYTITSSVFSLLEKGVFKIIFGNSLG